MKAWCCWAEVTEKARVMHHRWNWTGWTRGNDHHDGISYESESVFSKYVLSTVNVVLHLVMIIIQLVSINQICKNIIFFNSVVQRILSQKPSQPKLPFPGPVHVHLHLSQPSLTDDQTSISPILIHWQSSPSRHLNHISQPEASVLIGNGHSVGWARISVDSEVPPVSQVQYQLGPRHHHNAPQAPRSALNFVQEERHWGSWDDSTNPRLTPTRENMCMLVCNPSFVCIVQFYPFSRKQCFGLCAMLAFMMLYIPTTFQMYYTHIFPFLSFLLFALLDSGHGGRAKDLDGDDLDADNFDESEVLFCFNWSIFSLTPTNGYGYSYLS